MRMNKKASFISSPLVDFFSVMVFILIVIFFMFLINASLKQSEFKIENKAAALDNNALLMSYLRTPGIYDLIVGAYYNPQLQKQLKEKTTSTITGYSCFWITISNYKLGVANYDISGGPEASRLGVDCNYAPSKISAEIPIAKDKTVTISLVAVK